MALPAKERTLMPDERSGDPNLGRRIRTLRLAKGLKQRELGALLDPPVDQRTIATYETGARDVSTAYVRQFTKILETTAAYIYGETNDPLTPEARIRRAGGDPGNLDTLDDEGLRDYIADLFEKLRARSFEPPEGRRVQGEPDAGGEAPTVSTG
jgi:transcriptional regulator with XRE-family HTH domain